MLAPWRILTRVYSMSHASEKKVSTSGLMQGQDLLYLAFPVTTLVLEELIDFVILDSVMVNNNNIHKAFCTKA